MMIPDVIRLYPSTRAVFDRYGLKGCGGPEGPPESIEFFSRAHAVPLDGLLVELGEAARREQDSPLPPDYHYEETLGDLLYKWFFKAGIVVSLSVGCLFGALMLLYYAMERSFYSVPINLIHLHGHAQIFGWIGLIVMGFAYQAYPRFKYTTLARPKLAAISFVLMVAGLIIRSVAQGLFNGSLLIVPGVFSGVLELVAVSLFVVVMIKTLRQSDPGVDFYDKFILTALVAFWLVALLNPLLFYLINSAPDERTMVELIGTWLFPYRELQLLGFACMLIYGVSLRYVPAILGFKERGRSMATTIYYLFLTATVADITFYLLMRTGSSPIWGTGLQVSFLLMLLSAILMVRQMGLFSSPAEWDRSVKFIRTAYAWLILAFIMLSFFPVYNRLTEQAFSHAFFGAYRHALTVGFISMMILGVSSKVIPVLSGRDPGELSPLNHAFYLLNIGNLIRVSAQIATDHVGWAYPIMGVSGFLEVSALALWGVDIWRTMNSRVVQAAEVGSGLITAAMKVADVLDSYPQTEEVFMSHGFTDIQNPVMRNTIARAATLRMACGVHHVDVNEFVDALNRRVSAE